MVEGRKYKANIRNPFLTLQASFVWWINFCVCLQSYYFLDFLILFVWMCYNRGNGWGRLTYLWKVCLNLFIQTYSTHSILASASPVYSFVGDNRNMFGIESERVKWAKHAELLFRMLLLQADFLIALHLCWGCDRVFSDLNLIWSSLTLGVSRE